MTATVVVVKRSVRISLSFGLLILMGVAGTACSGRSSGQDPVTGGPTGRSAPLRSAPSPSPPAVGGPLAAVVPVERRRGLLLVRGFTVGPIAYSDPYLVWEAEEEEEVNPTAGLLVKNLKTGKVRELASDPFLAYGLAATPIAIIYARRSGAASDLVAVAPNGRHRRILARSLLAQFDARGDVVAWAEGDQSRQRVVVRNMRTGRQFVAMEMPRCPHGHCYRIDRVTVADQGVVFDLGAVGQGYPSLIVRRSLTAAKPALAKVADDPQPDLARSSEGALYYQFQRGWMRWDFGRSQPHATRYRGTEPQLLAEEQGGFLLLVGTNCKQRLLVRLRGGRTIRLPAPTSTPVSPKKFGPLCRQLTGFSWVGKRVLLAWSLTPKVSLESHTDIGLAGIVTAAQVP